MIKLKMDVTLGDKVETINASTREFIDLEEKFDCDIGDFQDHMKITWLAYLAYRAMWWTRKFTGTWEEFRELNPYVEVIQSGDALPKDPATQSQEPVSLSPTTPEDSPTVTSEI